MNDGETQGIILPVALAYQECHLIEMYYDLLGKKNLEKTYPKHFPNVL